MTNTLARILEHRIIVIVRGARPDDFFRIADALLEGGLSVIEVTLNSPGALSVIQKAAGQTGSPFLIGAGTVLDASEARSAIDAGAKFIISPSLDADTIHVTKKQGAVSIPGAFTPTEILAAHRNGADIIKVFPASAGPGYFRDIRGPLPHIPLMPTGGVNLSNIGEFRKAGAVAFGIGSALVDTSQPVTPAWLRQITENARKYAEAAQNQQP